MADSIRSQQELLNIFRDGQPTNSITAQDMRDLIVSVPAMATTLQGNAGVQGVQGFQGIQGVQGTQGIQGVQGVQGTQGIQGIQGLQGLQGIQGTSGNHGWQFYYDSQYTQGSPRYIPALTHATITINGGQETLGHPPGAPAFWNTTTNKIIPSGLNNFGIIRLAFAGYFTGGGSTSLFDVHLDVGGTTGIIWEESGIFLKGASNTQYFNFTIPLFSGPDFQANGGELHFIPQSDCYMWQFALTAVQIYSAL